MAVNIDKSVSQAPQGIEELAQKQTGLSIEIENPDSVTLDDGSMEIINASTCEKTFVQISVKLIYWRAWP